MIGLVVCVSAGVVVDYYEDEGSANGPPTTSIVPQLIIGMVRMIVLGNVVIYDRAALRNSDAISIQQHQYSNRTEKA